MSYFCELLLFNCTHGWVIVLSQETTLIYPWSVREQWILLPTNSQIFRNQYLLSTKKQKRMGMKYVNVYMCKYAMSTLHTNTLALVGEMCLADILSRDLFLSVLFCRFPCCFEFDVEWGISLPCYCMRGLHFSVENQIKAKGLNQAVAGFAVTCLSLALCYSCGVFLVFPLWFCFVGFGCCINIFIFLFSYVWPVI